MDKNDDRYSEDNSDRPQRNERGGDADTEGTPQPPGHEDERFGWQQAQGTGEPDAGEPEDETAPPESRSGDQPSEPEPPTDQRPGERDAPDTVQRGPDEPPETPTDDEQPVDDREDMQVGREQQREEVLDIEVDADEQQQAPPGRDQRQQGAEYGAGQTAGPEEQAPGGTPPPGAQQGYPPPRQPSRQPPRRGMSGCLIAILVVLGILVVGGIITSVVIGMTSAPSRSGKSFGVGGEYVGVIRISGMITTGGSGPSLLGPTTYGAEAIMSQLRKAYESKNIKAVLLRINSPGGSAAASQEIYREVMRLREKKPVIVSMADVAASGGYYVASAGNTIVADRATLTGSLGVIMQSINWHELANEYGVDDNTIKSGKFKDLMNPMRPMSDDDRKLAQKLVDDVYRGFVKDVAKGRKNLDVQRVKELADGRIYTGRQAKKNGLVDELGNYHQAIKIAAKEGGIEGKPKTKSLGGGRGWYGLLGSLIRGLQGRQWKTTMPLPSRLGPGIWMVWQGGGAVVSG